MYIQQSVTLSNSTCSHIIIQKWSTERGREIPRQKYQDGKEAESNPGQEKYRRRWMKWIIVQVH